MLPQLPVLKKPNWRFNKNKMTKFLVDENLSPLIASHLRKQGYNAKAVRELGLIGKPDEVILNSAQDKAG